MLRGDKKSNILSISQFVFSLLEGFFVGSYFRQRFSMGK